MRSQAFAKSLPGALLGLTVWGCTTAPPPDHGLPPERLAQVQHICANTMELSPGDVHFEDCMDVLSDTALRIDRARARP